MSLTKTRLLYIPKVLQLRNFYRFNSSQAIAATNTAAQSLTSSDYSTILLPEHRERCLKSMRGLPSFPRSKNVSPEYEHKAASVLIAMCLDSNTNEISLLYTRRSRQLRRHSLQISFPGGLRDVLDASFTNCALRETEEEIGLPRSRIEIWGEASLLRFPHTAAIMPVIGVVPNFQMSELKLNPEEVEEAFSIPLNELLKSNALHYTQFRSGYSGPVFVMDQCRIWGITAYLTYMFLRCLLPPTMLPEALKTKIKFIRPHQAVAKPICNVEKIDTKIEIPQKQQ